jgi:hypothetical protein
MYGMYAKIFNLDFVKTSQLNVLFISKIVYLFMYLQD